LDSQSLVLVLGVLPEMKKFGSVFLLMLFKKEMEPEGLEKVLLVLVIILLPVLVEFVKKLLVFVGFIEEEKLLFKTLVLVLVFVLLLKKLLFFPNEPENVFILLILFKDVDTGVWPI
jgi:hypothetical protein